MFDYERHIHMVQIIVTSSNSTHDLEANFFCIVVYVITASCIVEIDRNGLRKNRASLVNHKY